MSIIFVLIPLGLGLLAIAVWAFVWAVNNEQFDDLDRAAHSILFEEEDESARDATASREPTADTSPDAGHAEDPCDDP